MIIRKILASSTYALIFTLTHIKERLQKMLETEQKQRFSIDEIIDDEDELSILAEADFESELEEDSLFDDDNEIDIKRLKKEIEALEGFIVKAQSIKTESKAQALLTALEEAFKKLQSQGAEQKALIFTESIKTQAYVKDFLEANGYKDRIVLFNGIANEPQTKEIYQQWCLNNPEKVSGIKAADRRAAAVDYFHTKADIMIATEAAAEGLNLQFCSLVINYDLPWNPQRIEQRIGRCHRYGQKFDVVVVNFLNMRNYADVRVLNLLSSKFKLFDDVFGASDEVLGQADTIDIESRIWEIYQQCRSEEEIAEAFEKLQEDMQEQIDERMMKVRSDVLENFDINVQEHLRMTRDNTGAFLNRYQYMFWELTKYILSAYAVFNDNKHSFVLRRSVAGQKPGKYAMLRNDSKAIPYRLNSILAQHVINSALSIQTDTLEVIAFSQEALPFNATLPEWMIGQSGYLILASLSVNAMSDEQYLLFNAMTDDGKTLSQDECEKLFLNGGEESMIKDVDASVKTRLQKDVAQHSSAKLQEIDSRNLTFFKQEENRIYQWEHDVIDGIEAEISTVKKTILQTEREARNAQSVYEKIALERKVDDLKRKKRRLRIELEDREDDVAEQRKKMINELEQRLIKQSETDNLFIVRWSVQN